MLSRRGLQSAGTPLSARLCCHKCRCKQIRPWDELQGRPCRRRRARCRRARPEAEHVGGALVVRCFLRPLNASRTLLTVTMSLCVVRNLTKALQVWGGPSDRRPASSSHPNLLSVLLPQQRQLAAAERRPAALTPACSRPLTVRRCGIPPSAARRARCCAPRPPACPAASPLATSSRATLAREQRFSDGPLGSSGCMFLPAGAAVKQPPSLAYHAQTQLCCAARPNDPRAAPSPSSRRTPPMRPPRIRYASSA